MPDSLCQQEEIKDLSVMARNKVQSRADTWSLSDGMAGGFVTTVWSYH